METNNGGAQLDSEKFQMVDINLLFVDEQVQGKFSLTRAKAYLKNFDYRAFGVLEVSKRGKYYHVLDGQHRLWVAKYLKMDKVPCIVHENLTLQDEGILFLIPNTNRKKPSTLENFRIRVSVGESIATAVSDIIEKSGSKVDYKTSSSRYSGISAIGACEQIYKYTGPDALAFAIKSILEIWGDYALDNTMLKGMARFYKRYSQDQRWNYTILVSKLKNVEPSTIRRNARTEMEAMGQGAETAAANVIARIYNKGLTKNRISVMEGK